MKKLILTIAIVAACFSKVFGQSASCDECIIYKYDNITKMSYVESKNNLLIRNNVEYQSLKIKVNHLTGSIIMITFYANGIEQYFDKSVKMTVFFTDKSKLKLENGSLPNYEGRFMIAAGGLFKKEKEREF